MTEERCRNILGGATFLSTFVPVMFFRRNGHDCHDGRCMQIWHDGELGNCLLASMDDLTLFLAIAWCFAITGGAIVASKDRHAVSPFLAIGVLLACCIYVALLDPSKRPMAYASLVPAVLFFACSYYDHEKRD